MTLACVRIEGVCRYCGSLKSLDACPVLLDVVAGVQTPTSLPCVHLGAELRRVVCESCGGKKTQLKVFRCELFQECTLGRKLDGIACCQTCGDYEASPNAC